MLLMREGGKNRSSLFEFLNGPIADETGDTETEKKTLTARVWNNYLYSYNYSYSLDVGVLAKQTRLRGVSVAPTATVRPETLHTPATFEITTRRHHEQDAPRRPALRGDGAFPVSVVMGRARPLDRWRLTRMP